MQLRITDAIKHKWLVNGKRYSAQLKSMYKIQVAEINFSAFIYRTAS